MNTRTTTNLGIRGTCSAQANGSRILGANGTKRMIMGLALAVAAMLPQRNAWAMPVEFGSASSFAVLAGTGITITGPTAITGDIGTYPTTTITGLGTLTLDGVNHGGDEVTQSARSALLSAYNDAGGRAYDLIYAGGFDLVGQTLNAGVYRSDSSLALSGTLTLDAQGDPDAVFIIQTGSTLITASGSQVNLINGAQMANIIWQVGSSATLATGSYFVGNILAHDSITLTTGATVDGRVLALNGAVTFDSNTVVVPEGSTFCLLGIGLVGLATVRRRFKSSVGLHLI